MKKHLSNKLLKRLSIIIAICVVIAIIFTIYMTSINAALATGKSKFLGNVIGSSVPANYGEYWNQVTPENATKWGSVESSQDNMNWSQADTIYNYSKTNNIPFKFHTLVWGSQEPGWIGGLSNADKKAEVEEWIAAAGTKYGSCALVDVVNEPLHAKPSFKDAIGGDGSTGWDWVVWSFETASKHFNGTLILNDYGIVNDDSACANYLKIINILKEKGLIDAIGVQAHLFNLEDYPVSTIKGNLDKLAATGLPIYPSEIDLSGDDATQLKHYQEKFPVIWEHPGVKGCTLWGYLVGQTWRDNTGLVYSGDIGATERPAMQWLKQYVSGTTVSTTVSTSPSVSPSQVVSSSPSVSPSQVVSPSVSPSQVVSPSPSQSTGSGVTATVTVVNEWGSGGQLKIVIKNNSSTATNGWSVAINVPGTISNIWCAKGSGSGNVTITNENWNGVIPAGGSVEAGCVYTK